MRRFWPLLLFVVISIVVWQLPHTQKTTSSHEGAPQRIISMAPSITEIAFALGLNKQVVAVTDFCRYPVQACSLPKVGGYVDPNLEKIVALHPDLVILLKTANRVQAKLTQLGIHYLTVDNTTLQNIENSIKQIGKATGQVKQANQLLAGMQRQINAIKHKVAGLPRPNVMVAIAHQTNSSHLNNVYIAGRHDFYNDLIQLAGGRNAYQNQRVKVPALSTEGIVKLDPDVIIDVFPGSNNHHIDQQQVMTQWLNLPPIKAVRNKRIYIINQPYGSIPGPRVILLLQQMARMIHPELDWSTDDASD